MNDSSCHSLIKNGRGIQRATDLFKWTGNMNCRAMDKAEETWKTRRRAS